MTKSKKKTTAKPVAKKSATPWWQALVSVSACESAVEWCQGFTSLAKAWEVCERPDWMLWLIGRMSYCEPWSDGRKPLVRLACAIARTQLNFIPAGEERPRKAIETAERWCDGQATREEVERAYAYAYASAYAYAYAYASASAYAYAYASASAYAYAREVRKANKALWIEQCDLIRQHYPKPPKLVAQ